MTKNWENWWKQVAKILILFCFQWIYFFSRRKILLRRNWNALTFDPWKITFQSLADALIFRLNGETHCRARPDVLGWENSKWLSQTKRKFDQFLRNKATSCGLIGSQPGVSPSPLKRCLSVAIGNRLQATWRHSKRWSQVGLLISDWSILSGQKWVHHWRCWRRSARVWMCTGRSTHLGKSLKIVKISQFCLWQAKPGCALQEESAER